MTASNPVLVEVTRGQLVESRHRGAIAVCDADGKLVMARGNVDELIFPRSAVKAIQALPLVESGAADQFGFGEKELALACSSHSGEAAHVERAKHMLQQAGLDESCLECGGHWSLQQKVGFEQIRVYGDTPPAVCNNCSGKHSGFVCTAAHQGIDPAGYIRPEHPIQQTIKEMMTQVTGAVHEADQCGTDGCSIPTYAIALSNLATGFAKMASGQGLSTERTEAARRLMAACMAEPFYVAGTNRFCTQFMEAGNRRLFAKTGAEGVFCGAIPELGLGIALKCDDGAARAAEVMMAATTSALLPKDDALQVQLADLSVRKLKNWNRIEVGEIRPVAGF